MKNLSRTTSNAKPLALAMFAALSMAATSANAALTMDSAAVLADIAIVVAFVTAIGVGVIGLKYVKKAFAWAGART